ncbi:FAD-dependent monooxygenase [Nonomuraea sp. NPDC003214]
MTETEVVIAGGGLVGLTLAHELGSRGIGCVLVEPRTEAGNGSPRCKQINPRSMEIFRRLGVAADIRDNARLPFGWADSAVFCASLTGHRIERFDGIFGLTDVRRDELAEPAQWCGQNRVEEALRATLARRPTVEARWGRSVTRVEQEAGGVTAETVDEHGRRELVRGRYLVGADGGRGVVRGELGIRLSGETHAVRNVQAVFHAPGLTEAHPHGRAVQYWVVNPEVSGLMGPLDTEGAWWAIIIGAPEDPDPAWVERALHTMIGREHPVDVRLLDPWTARMLVADRYREGRCFLAGDAAHLNPPWGGFGANTGIGDAVDLGWKLAAELRGWAGAGLLDSYEAERRPMAERTIAEAAANMRVLTGELARPGLDDDSDEGAQARLKAAELIRQTKANETYTLGFVLGARYAGSPLIAADDGPAPVSSTSVYRPSGAPGSRLPHFWQSRDRSLYDALGPGFTLLEIATDPADAAWEEAAAARGIPFTRHHLHRPDLLELYGARYVLVRPDHHIAWRGDTPPDPGTLLDHARGA